MYQKSVSETLRKLIARSCGACECYMPKYWCLLRSDVVSIPMWSSEGRERKNDFLLLWLILNTVEGKLRGFSGASRWSEVENKYKEEMVLGGTNAPAVEHTVWSARLILRPEEGTLSGERKQFKLLELPVIWSRSSLDSTTEKEMSKNGKPRVAHQKDIWSCCPQWEIPPPSSHPLPSHALLKQLMSERIQNIAGMYQRWSFCIAEQLNSSGFVCVRADCLAFHRWKSEMAGQKSMEQLRPV